MALDFKQKGLLSLLLAEDPSAQQYLYNWNKLKTYDDEIQKYRNILYSAEALSENTTKSEAVRNEAKKIADEARALME